MEQAQLYDSADEETEGQGRVSQAFRGALSHEEKPGFLILIPKHFSELQVIKYEKYFHLIWE